MSTNTLSEPTMNQILETSYLQAGGVAQWWCLPSMYEDLGCIHSATK